MDRGHPTDSFVISYSSFSAGCISTKTRLFYGEKMFNLQSLSNSFNNHGYDLGSKTILKGIPLSNNWDKEVRASAGVWTPANATTHLCQQQASMSELDSGLLFTLDFISGFQVSGGLCSDSQAQNYCKIKRRPNLDLEEESLALFETYKSMRFG